MAEKVVTPRQAVLQAHRGIAAMLLITEALAMKRRLVILSILSVAMLFLASRADAQAVRSRAAPSASAQDSVAPPSAGQVWVNTKSGIYHCPGSRYYGATAQGTFLSEAAAVARGYRAARGQDCGSAPAATPQAAPAAPTPAAAGGGTRVWVNTRSGVYHCPGSRYFGTTAAGTYMTQQQARSRGHRPAFGRACS